MDWEGALDAGLAATLGVSAPDLVFATVSGGLLEAVKGVGMKRYGISAGNLWSGKNKFLFSVL